MSLTFNVCLFIFVRAHRSHLAKKPSQIILIQITQNFALLTVDREHPTVKKTHTHTHYHLHHHHQK